MSSHTAPLCIPHDHPALPGHFPGRPVVPGVLLLDAVVEAAEAWTAAPLPLAGLPLVKFAAPLLPGEQARIVLERHGTRLRFRVLRGDTLVASGELEPCR